jgi:hypothetical protein
VTEIKKPTFQYIHSLFKTCKDRDIIYKSLLKIITKENNTPENRKSLDEFNTWVKNHVDKKTQTLSSQKENKGKKKKDLELIATQDTQNTIQKVAPRLFE